MPFLLMSRLNHRRNDRGMLTIFVVVQGLLHCIEEILQGLRIDNIRRFITQLFIHLLRGCAQTVLSFT